MRKSPQVLRVKHENCEFWSTLEPESLYGPEGLVAFTLFLMRDGFLLDRIY